MFCIKCGKQMDDGTAFCPACGTRLNASAIANPTFNPGRTHSADKGGKSIAGFILAMVSLFMPVPVLDIIVGIAGFILSAIGLVGDKPRKGFAIAGIIIASVAVTGAIYILATQPDFYENLYK